MTRPVSVTKPRFKAAVFKYDQTQLKSESRKNVKSVEWKNTLPAQKEFWV